MEHTIHTEQTLRSILNDHVKKFGDVQVRKRYIKSGIFKVAYMSLSDVIYNVRKESTHHTLIGKNERYFFIPIELDGPSLEVSLYIAREIQKIFDRYGQQFFIKVSGNRSVHICSCFLFKHRDMKYLIDRGFFNVYHYFKSMIFWLYDQFTDDVKSKCTVIPQDHIKNENLVYIDGGLFQRNHMIRCVYSFHEKTNMFAIPIKLNWSYEMIKHLMLWKNVHKTFFIPIKYPIWKLYEYDIKPLNCDNYYNNAESDIKLDFKNIDSKNMRMQLIDYIVSNEVPCISQVKSDINAGHILRNHVVRFLRTEGFNINEIANYFISILSKDKALHQIKEERQALELTWNRGYRTNCINRMIDGLCLGKSCPKYEEAKKLWHLRENRLKQRSWKV